jgi:hypothetical protein
LNSMNKAIGSMKMLNLRSWAEVVATFRVA